MAEKSQRKAAVKARKKKPWAAPRVKSGRLFESNSLACSKNQDPMNHDMCAADIQLS